MAPVYAEWSAQEAAQSAEDDAVWQQQYEEDELYAEYEELGALSPLAQEAWGVLSPQVMADEEAASAAALRACISDASPLDDAGSDDDEESPTSEYDQQLAYDLADYQVLLFNVDDQHPDERVRI
jgi:hypothetical protein